MPGSNFNPRLPINPGTHFVEWPAGPLFPATGETMLRVEVWVMQKTTGAIQMSYQDTFPANPTTWIANDSYYPNPWQGGRFRPGPALGTAVAIATKPSGQSYYWWTQEVELV
jgi:hypothetical protein